MFLDSGHETEAVQVMQKNWMDQVAKNHPPKISQVLLNYKVAHDNIILNMDSMYTANITAQEPDKDNLYYYWEIMPESTDLNGGGDWEEQPKAIQNLIGNNRVNQIKIKAPSKEGPYRLYVYVYDDYNHAATANIPFYVVP